MQMVVYPLDTVRTRLAVCSKTEYASIWATAQRMARKEGYSSFYRGLVPSMVGSIAPCMFQPRTGALPAGVCSLDAC